MQGTETGCSKHLDDNINFRPSPNFKHMKKYLKSKFEEENELKRLKGVISSIQPPLPPNSPPPDSPITLKQEIEDDGYERALSGGCSPGAGDDASADAAAAAAAAAADAAAMVPAADAPLADRIGPKNFTMCKDWVRGTCSRGAACIYVHELDKSQLKGVYRFCHDFENSRCKRQMCYFVHATTFEKEHFYRTAKLPPHALQHLKSVAPQPAAAAPSCEVAAQPELPPLFANPPPPPALASGAVVPMGPGGAGGGAATAGAGALEARLPLDAFAAAAALPAAAPATPAAHAAGALKREWRDLDDFSSPPRDLDSEPPARKCKHCPVTTLRLQHSKAQMAQALRASQALDDRLEQVIARHERLQAVLKSLLKPRRALDHVRGNLFDRDRDREAGDDALLEQIKVFVAKKLLGSEADGLENGRDLAS